jgi:hypothetical protein
MLNNVFYYLIILQNQGVLAMEETFLDAMEMDLLEQTTRNVQNIE